MRYNKGRKVEVLSQKDVPSWSWRGAEIICGNGHTYTVRYDGYVGTTDEAIVERVSRKFIRPRPPTLDVSENWVSGDIVEVFDKFCWKMATISKVFGEEYFLVRVLGSTQAFKVNKVYLRVRLSWQDNEWFIIGMGSRSCEGGNHTEQSTLKCHQNVNSQFRTADAMANPLERDNCFSIKEKTYIQQIQNGSSGTLKRKLPFCELPVEVYSGISQKFRLPNDDADSATCSVGSCSVSGNVIYELPNHRPVGHTDDTGDNLSVAESLCRWRNEEGDISLSTRVELAEEIHRLELHAYHCTMEALYASGPLSWEQESLVTDLRMSLHISNDEHLLELRNLISTDASIPIR